jgi:hypothetical protein
MISFLLDTGVQIAMQKIANALFAPSHDEDPNAVDIDIATLAQAFSEFIEIVAQQRRVQIRTNWLLLLLSVASLASSAYALHLAHLF